MCVPVKEHRHLPKTISNSLQRYRRVKVTKPGLWFASHCLLCTFWPKGKSSVLSQLEQEPKGWLQRCFFCTTDFLVLLFVFSGTAVFLFLYFYLHVFNLWLKSYEPPMSPGHILCPQCNTWTHQKPAKSLRLRLCISSLFCKGLARALIQHFKMYPLRRPFWETSEKGEKKNTVLLWTEGWEIIGLK